MINLQALLVSPLTGCSSIIVISRNDNKIQIKEK